MATLEDLARWLQEPEAEHLEFKEARNNFHFEKLVKYCCALANEGGGRIVFGVTDKRPRRVVGSDAFGDLERTKAGLIERLRLRIEATVLAPEGRRVLVFEVPSRPLGVPMSYEGAYWMRAGEDLAPMTADMLARIFAEAQPDFTALPCPQATIDDLDPRAIEDFRRRWLERSRRAEVADAAPARLLADAELVVDGQVTYAALVLLGEHRALGRHLANAEVIFEYRGDDASIGYDQRKEYRQGLLLFHDELWRTIDLRNTVTSYLDGLFRHEVPAFNEDASREAVLNAVSHRDYRLSGSVFVKQWPQRLQVVSPGGFPPGVTAENIVFTQAPRNRRLADALARCGLVERSGQGADRIFGAAVREGKLPPDFTHTDAWNVWITLQGKVQDEAFLRFLRRVNEEQQRPLVLEDLLVIDAVHREQPIREALQPRVPALLAAGVLERVARKKLVLCRRFYAFVGRPGEYTRRKGLDRETNKALLLQHIEGSRDAGVPFEELSQVLPALSREQIRWLLRQLRDEGRAHVSGAKRGSRWHPGPGTPITPITHPKLRQVRRA